VVSIVDVCIPDILMQFNKKSPNLTLSWNVGPYGQHHSLDSLQSRNKKMETTVIMREIFALWKVVVALAAVWSAEGNAGGPGTNQPW